MRCGTLCGRRALGKVRVTRRNDEGRDEKAERQRGGVRIERDESL